jgi:hypothetical protein
MVQKILLDKFNFRFKLNQYPKKVTHYQSERKDAFSKSFFGTVGLEHRYYMLISNEKKQVI